MLEQDEEIQVQEDGTLGLMAFTKRSSAMASAHRHLDLEINYVLSGIMTYLVGGRIVDLPLRRLCLLWGSVPHQTIHSPMAAEAIWVIVPLTVVLRWGLPDRLIQPLLANGFLADAAPRPGDLDLLKQWLEDFASRDARRNLPGGPDTGDVEIVQLEIEARLRRFAHALSYPTTARPESRSGSSAHADHGMTSVEAMAQFITRNFREAIGTVEIAGAAHLHPNYAMSLFRRHTGMTISRYLILQRVAHAQRRLATSSDAIPVIALDSGFGSVSRFYEAFRQQTGNSPRRFRLRMDAKRTE